MKYSKLALSVLNLKSPGCGFVGLCAVVPFGGTKYEVAENVDTPTISGAQSQF